MNKFNFYKLINVLKIVIFSFFIFSCSSGSESGETIDMNPPTIPSSLQASEITQTSVKLTWAASTDNVGVVSYSIYNNNSALTSSINTSKEISGLTENTVYSFKVLARDAAGNTSSFSNTVEVNTENSNVLQNTSGDIEAYIGNIIDSSPGSSGNNYKSPLISQLNIWDSIISDILSNNINDAVANVGTLDYQITEFTDTSLTPNQVFYVLEKKSNGGNYWGTYVFSKTPATDNLILMAPHVKYDTNTGKQAVFCFKSNLAKVLMINGTHRCNANQASSCSGTTSTCGSSAAYRLSDVAHTVQSAFQKTTENIFNNVTNSVFIQLHGFGRQSGDPYVILSNGTREVPTTDYTVLLRDALLTEDNTLTFKIAHIDTDWTRLIGFTNTQGRLINNSSNPCNSSATSTSGRFIHIEQEKSKLREDESGWKKMSDALKVVF